MKCHKIYISIYLVYNIAMNTVDYLKEVYGYGVPIFLKDVRIGKKSKTSIRKDLSRGVLEGKISREGQGIYFLKEDTDIPLELSFEDVVEKKFVKDDFGFPGLNMNIYGYYSGITFLHSIGLTQQVPAVLEIVTNHTSCKRLYIWKGYRAILRTPKIKIDRFNYRALQFFDAISILTTEEIKKNHNLLFEYIYNNLQKSDFENYIHFYPTRVVKAIVEGGFINAFR